VNGALGQVERTGPLSKCGKKKKDKFCLDSSEGVRQKNKEGRAQGAHLKREVDHYNLPRESPEKPLLHQAKKKQTRNRQVGKGGLRRN